MALKSIDKSPQVPPLFPSTILLGHARPTAARNHPRAPDNTSTRRLVELLRPPRPSKVTYQPTLTLSTPSNAPSSPRPLKPEEVSSDPNKCRAPLQRTRCTRRTGAGTGGRGRGRREDNREDVHPSTTLLGGPRASRPAAQSYARRRAAAAPRGTRRCAPRTARAHGVLPGRRAAAVAGRRALTRPPRSPPLTISNLRSTTTPP